MKKFISALVILVTAITVVIVGQGTAHYIRRCRYNHCLPVRKTTSRIFPFNQYQLRRQIEREARIRRNTGNKFLFWKNYKRQISRKYNSQNYMTYKLAHRSLFPRINNVLPQPHKIAVRETAYHQNYKWDSLKIKETIAKHNQQNFVRYGGNNFTLKMPKSFVKTTDGKIYDAARDLTVSIKQDNNDCEGLSFQLCASKRNAEFRENMDMDDVKNLEQNFRLRQVLVGGESILFPTYQETFENEGQVYYIYTNMNPLTGNIVTISGISPVENKFAAGNLMETLFRGIQL